MEDLNIQIHLLFMYDSRTTKNTAGAVWEQKTNIWTWKTDCDRVVEIYIIRFFVTSAVHQILLQKSTQEG